MTRSAYPLVEMELASSGLKSCAKGPAAMAATLMTPLGPDRRPPPLELQAAASSTIQAVTTPALPLLVSIDPLLAEDVTAHDARYSILLSYSLTMLHSAGMSLPSRVHLQRASHS